MTEVRLREVEDADLEVFFANQSDPVAYRMAAFAPRERSEFLAHWAKVLADDSAVTRTIVVDGEVVGDIGSWEQDGAREIGYWIDRRHWGRGIATRALSLFLDLLPVRPVYAHVADHNAGSMRVLEKCGFRRIAGGVGPDGIAEAVFVQDR